MSTIARFSVSIEQELLDRFLRTAKKRGWGNRSVALRNLIRDAMVREEWEADAEIVGTITLVYDHQRELSDKLTSIQHDHHDGKEDPVASRSGQASQRRFTSSASFPSNTIRPRSSMRKRVQRLTAKSRS